VPQAVKPVFEEIANRNSFTGAPIVSMSMQRKLPTEQYNARTSAGAKALADGMDILLSPIFGKKTNVTGIDALRSPVRLEHLINGYFGGLGGVVLGLSDRATRWMSDDPVLPASRGPEDWPFIRAFYRGEAGSPGHTKFEGELYGAMDQADSLYSSIKFLRESGDIAAEQKLKADLTGEDKLLLRKRQPLASLRRQFNKINQSIQAVYLDRYLSAEAKRKRVDELQTQKSELARREWQKITGLRRAA
jgi:hypothetical protein